LPPECIFSTLKSALKVKDVKTRKIANVLKTAGNISKSSKGQSKEQLLGVLRGMVIGFK